jgi:hypothetical protein
LFQSAKLQQIFIMERKNRKNMIVLPHSGHKFKFAKQLSVAKPEKITFLQKKGHPSVL